jgi:hypothetical protein
LLPCCRGITAAERQLGQGHRFSKVGVALKSGFPETQPFAAFEIFVPQFASFLGAIQGHQHPPVDGRFVHLAPGHRAKLPKKRVVPVLNFAFSIFYRLMP